MKIDMDAWLAEQMKAGKKKPLPILSFPGVQLIHRSVDEMVHSGSLQAKCMQAIAERYDTAAALTLMDLSVEAEAFGSPVYYSDNEVPTVTEAIVKTPCCCSPFLSLPCPRHLPKTAPMFCRITA